MRRRHRRHGSASKADWGRRPTWIPLQPKVVRPLALLGHRTTTASKVRPRRDTTTSAVDPLMLTAGPHPHMKNRRRDPAIANDPHHRQVPPAMAAKAPRLAMPGRIPSGPLWAAGPSHHPVNGREKPRCSPAVTSVRRRIGTTWRAGYPLAMHRRPGPGTPRRPKRVRSAPAPLPRLLRRNAASRAHRSGPLPHPGRSSGAGSPPRRVRVVGRIQIRSAVANWCPPARFRHHADGAARYSWAVSG
jgi:hypothetical protein